ncbi:MAG: cobalamin-binding protein [Methanobacteriota archaeon]|nr:MAG: cobalamin-binding protein [Euryarchaeota archaeon]
MKEVWKSALSVWMVVVIVGVALMAFTGGYYAGTILSSKEGIVIVDDYGRQIKLSGTPERIVSIAPTATEILFAIGAGEQVVGVDTYSDYPAEAQDLAKVGDAFALNVEAIVALDPDLVVTADLVPEALNTVEARGIPYMVLAVRTLDAAVKDIRMMGALTGHIEEATALADSLDARILAVKEKTLATDVERPKVYVEYYEYFTFGPGSFGDDMIRAAGGINIAGNASSEYPYISAEFVVAANPEVIVYTVGVMTTIEPSDFGERPGWSELDAVVNEAIYSIDDNLVSRYGPRVVDGLEELAAILHPDLFE